jgi:hypothetical protein
LSPRGLDNIPLDVLDEQAVDDPSVEQNLENVSSPNSRTKKRKINSVTKTLAFLEKREEAREKRHKEAMEAQAATLDIFKSIALSFQKFVDK